MLGTCWDLHPATKTPFPASKRSPNSDNCRCITSGCDDRLSSCPHGVYTQNLQAITGSGRDNQAYAYSTYHLEIAGENQAYGSYTFDLFQESWLTLRTMVERIRADLFHKHFCCQEWCGVMAIVFLYKRAFWSPIPAKDHHSQTVGFPTKNATTLGGYYHLPVMITNRHVFMIIMG